MIMLQYRPWLEKDSPLNKAIDAAHKRGIGLISMKQIAGNYLGDKPQGSILQDVVRRVPVLGERKLTPYQGLLHAIWTDERMSAVSYDNAAIPTISAKTLMPPHGLSRSRRLRSVSFATQRLRGDRRCALTAMAAVRLRPEPRPS